MHKISKSAANPRKLSQSVIQITQMLGMYQAELARVLHVMCSDVGELANGSRELEPGTPAWQQAELFCSFYNRLFDRMQGDAVTMRNWLRKDNNALHGTPLLLIIDDNQLVRLHDFLGSKE